MSTREVNPPRKALRQNLNSGPNSGPSTNSLNQQTSDTDDGSVSFHHEISDIMPGFSDCERPQRESVQLVEQILNQQLRGILNQATEIAYRRKGAAFPTQGDFEFLMRRHPVKINRMRKHLKDMKTFRRILQMQFGRTQTLAEDSENAESDKDTEMEIPEKFDEKTRRLFRADRISQILTGQQYQLYKEARRTDKSLYNFPTCQKYIPKHYNFYLHKVQL